MRYEYGIDGLTEESAGNDPLALFESWLAEAVAAKITEPNALALATATADGAPSVRIVLLKSIDASGAVFHTNYESRKGKELSTNPRAAAVMLWHPVHRQVRIEGSISRLSAGESDEYFLSRPPGGRTSATSSPQSRVVADRGELERLWADAEASGAAERRPEYWGGYRLSLDSLEFWQGRANRLHDRIRFTRAGDVWQRDRLAP